MLIKFQLHQLHRGGQVWSVRRALQPVVERERSSNLEQGGIKFMYYQILVASISIHFILTRVNFN